MSGVKLFSWKRLAGSVLLAVLLFLAAEYFACGTGLSDGTTRWNLREFLGAALFPGAFVFDRFEQIRAGFFIIEELRIVLPLQLLYAYALLTAGSILKAKTGHVKNGKWGQVLILDFLL